MLATASNLHDVRLEVRLVVDFHWCIVDWAGAFHPAAELAELVAAPRIDDTLLLEAGIQINLGRRHML